MRKLLPVLLVAAVVSGAYFVLMSPDDGGIALQSDGGSRGPTGGAPITETAVLFGMLVALGVVGRKLASAPKDE